MSNAKGCVCILSSADGEELWEPLVVLSGLAVSIVALVTRTAFVLSFSLDPAPPAAAGEIAVL